MAYNVLYIEGKWGPIPGRAGQMRESQLEKELEQAEEVHDGLIQTRRSLGTILAETIRRGKDLEEFKRHRRDLPQLIWQADLRRTELRHELLDRRARRAEDDYRRAAEEASKATRALEQARRAYIKAEETAKRLGPEARRLAEQRDKEAKHLQELSWAPEDAQRYQGEHQRGEQGGETSGDARRGPRSAIALATRVGRNAQPEPNPRRQRASHLGGRPSPEKTLIEGARM